MTVPVELKTEAGRQKRAGLQQAAWSEALRQPVWTVSNVAAAAHVDCRLAGLFIRGWLAAGLIEIVHERKGGQRQVYQVCDRSRTDSPGGRTPHDNMWTTMRRIGAFTPADLAAHSTTETVAVTRTVAASYCRFLLAAGYLGVVRKARPPVVEPQYRLIRDTGPRPPMEVRVAAVRDPNTGTTTLVEGEV